MSRTVEGTFDGRHARLLTTVEGTGWIADTWDSPTEPRDGVFGFRTGVVFTVAPWAQESAQPWTPWLTMYAYGVCAQPSPDPVERFNEALRQEHERARERLSGPIEWQQVWP